LRRIEDRLGGETDSDEYMVKESKKVKANSDEEMSENEI